MSKMEEIIEKLDFHGLVSKKTQLKRFKGEQFKGLSPFTNEKTPSFFIDNQSKTWYCFSSSIGGGAIDYVMKSESVDRAEAIRILAEYAGVELDKETDPNYSTKRALKLALQYYIDNNEEAVEYMLSRGFSLDILDEYEIGYSGKDLFGFLKKNGVSNEDIVFSGLGFKKEDGTVVPRYRERVMIPIRDEYGTLVSFTSRDITNKANAKYLHGPTNSLFKKKKLIWGLKNSRGLIAKHNYVVVTEGPLDAMALVDCGIPAVCMLGTSVSEEQMKLLANLTQNIYFTFDSDEAGEKALFKSFKLARDLEIDSVIYSIVLPKGHDPHSYLNEFGVNDFMSLKEDAASDTASIVQSLIRNHYKAGSTKTSIAKKVLAELRDSFNQTFTYRSLDLIERLSQEFSINPKDLQDWIKKGTSFRGGGGVDKKILELSFPAPIYERRILYSVLKEPHLINKIINSPVSFGDFDSSLVSKTLASIPPTCSKTEVFDIIESKLSKEEYDTVLQFFSTGLSWYDFGSSFEVFKIKVAEREKKSSKVDILGRPVTATESELRTVFKEILDYKESP